MTDSDTKTGLDDRDRPRSLRVDAPWRSLEGFGRAQSAASRYVAPTSVDEMLATIARGRREGLPIAFRGSGRSYGDASINEGGLIIDGTKMSRMLAWDPQTGIAEAEPGLTIEGLWRRTLSDGYWPYVVPGTMHPTMGGCLSMNIHGKNNFKVGPFGEHVLDFDLVTPRGELLRCSRTDNPDVFSAAIGGLGLLGAITRARIQLKKVRSGSLRVTGLATRNLEETFDLFEQEIPNADYLVGWVDCLAGGDGLGRGQLHVANYLDENEDPGFPTSFNTERQTLPSTILGVPKSILWRFMAPFFNNFGVAMVNTAKYVSSMLAHRKSYVQSHVGFAFLLDYVPNWRLAYGSVGLIQYQVFLPKETARRALGEIIALGQKRGLPSYLGVFKRHRPDDFLLSHAVDGWSFAMDFKVTKGNRAALWKMTEEMTDIVVGAGGRFYFAKDSVLRPDDVVNAFGAERVARFRAIKERLDPEGVLSSNLSRRVMPMLPSITASPSPSTGAPTSASPTSNAAE